MNVRVAVWGLAVPRRARGMMFTSRAQGSGQRSTKEVHVRGL